MKAGSFEILVNTKLALLKFFRGTSQLETGTYSRPCFHACAQTPLALNTLL